MIKQTSLNFLTDLKNNNSREWFEQNKVIYQAYKDDIIQLGAVAFCPPYAHSIWTKFCINTSHLLERHKARRKNSFSTLSFCQKVLGFLNLKLIILRIPDSTIPLPHKYLFALKWAYCILPLCFSMYFIHHGPPLRL